MSTMLEGMGRSGLDPVWLAVALLVLMLGAAAIALRLQRWRLGWRLQRRAARGRLGETRAVGLLEAHGYQVLEEQVTGNTGLWVDGTWQPVKVRADLMASRNGKRFVVEVKTGQQAPDPTASATRRQLLEYHHVFEADGLLLADMEREQLRVIAFGPGPGEVHRRGPRGSGWRVIGFVFLSGLVCGLLLASIFRAVHGA